MYEITYCKTLLLHRYYRAIDEDTSRGASAMEWALITGILALIALTVGTIIGTKIYTSAGKIKTNPTAPAAP